MRLRGIKVKGLSFKEGLNLTPLSVPTNIKKHKYGATATWSHNTDQYRPLEGGYKSEVFALKHNLQVTTYLNHGVSAPYLGQAKEFFDSGRLSIGSYDLTAPQYESGVLNDDTYIDYMQAQVEWIKNNFDVYPSTASYGYGRQIFKDDMALRYLGIRNSTYNLNDYNYDLADTSTFASTTRHADMAGEWTTVIGSCNTALQNAITEGGWYRDFAHWHSNAKIEGFFEAQSEIIHNNDVITLGMGEALEYMKFRQSVTGVDVFTDGNKIYIRTQNNVDNLMKRLIRTTLSVEVDLTGTIFTGEDFTSTHGLQKIDVNKFIVEVPLSGYAVLSSDSGSYFNFNLPVITNLTSSTIVTDKPTRISVWQVPKGDSLSSAVLLSRDNILSTTHSTETYDTTSFDIYIGAITAERQSILHQL